MMFSNKKFKFWKISYKLKKGGINKLINVSIPLEKNSGKTMMSSLKEFWNFNNKNQNF